MLYAALTPATNWPTWRLLMKRSGCVSEQAAGGGGGSGDGDGPPPGATHALMVLLLKVTFAALAGARPLKLAPAAKVIAVSASIFPTNELPASSDAELTRRHQTLHDG